MNNPHPTPPDAEVIDLMRTLYISIVDACKAQGENKAKNKAEERALVKLLTAVLGRKPTATELAQITY